MQPLVLAACLSLATVVIPAAVFCLAARRLWRSRSRNAVLYWLVGGYAFAGFSGALRTGLLGGQVDAGGMVVALASLPLWVVARAVAGRSRTYGLPLRDGPVFTSARRRRGGLGLPSGAARSTTGA
jgi:hypothetical protein